MSKWVGGGVREGEIQKGSGGGSLNKTGIQNPGQEPSPHTKKKIRSSERRKRAQSQKNEGGETGNTKEKRPRRNLPRLLTDAGLNTSREEKHTPKSARLHSICKNAVKEKRVSQSEKELISEWRGGEGVLREKKKQGAVYVKRRQHPGPRSYLEKKKGRKIRNWRGDVGKKKEIS